MGDQVQLRGFCLDSYAEQSDDERISNDVQHTDIQNLITNYVEWLYRDVAQDYPAVLVLEVYPTHRTDLVFQTATASDVDLFVPAGLPEDSNHGSASLRGTQYPSSSRIWTTNVAH
jgi:hypothetical protein